MNPKITFYDGGCADCQKVSAFFSANGIDYDRKNIKAHPELADEAKKKGAKTFPAVFIGNGIVEGWDENALRLKLDIK